MPRFSGTIAELEQNCKQISGLSTELGTRQYCRDNVTRFSGQTIVDYCTLTISFVVTLLRHRAVTFFVRFLDTKAIFYVRCRVVVVAKLKNWRVPSSDYQASLNSKFDSISLKLSLNFYFRSLFLIYSPNYELNFCRPLLSRKEALTMQHCMRDHYYLATGYLLLTKDLTSISLIY